MLSNCIHHYTSPIQEFLEKLCVKRWRVIFWLFFICLSTYIQYKSQYQHFQPLYYEQLFLNMDKKKKAFSFISFVLIILSFICFMWSKVHLGNIHSYCSYTFFTVIVFITKLIKYHFEILFFKCNYLLMKCACISL